MAEFAHLITLILNFNVNALVVLLDQLATKQKVSIGLISNRRKELPWRYIA